MPVSDTHIQCVLYADNCGGGGCVVMVTVMVMVMVMVMVKGYQKSHFRNSYQHFFNLRLITNY